MTRSQQQERRRFAIGCRQDRVTHPVAVLRVSLIAFCLVVFAWDNQVIAVSLYWVTAFA